MKTSETIRTLLSGITDWIYSILVVAATLSIAILFWGRYNGITGFFSDFVGILETQLPVPFWVMVLLGVGLSITVYRKRSIYKEFLESRESTLQE